MAQFIDEPVTLKITRMRQIDDLDRGVTGEADFQSQVSIDGRQFNGKLFEEQDDLNPGSAWTFSNNAGQGNGLVPLKIKVTERDSGFLGGTGPTVDINPLAGKKELNFFLNQVTGEVFSTENGSAQRLGFVNQPITLRGAGDGERGEITFVVNSTPGSESANSVIIQNPFLSETPENNDSLGGKGIEGLGVTGTGGNSPLVSGDFNADGKADLVLGSAFERVAHVINGTNSGLDQSTLQTKFNKDNLGVDMHGSAFAVGDINGDKVDDLVIGGATTVVRFGKAGSSLTNGQNNIVKDPSFPNPSFVGVNSFGSTVTTGDFNGDGGDDVATGDPGANVGATNISNDGAVQVNYGSSAGITTSGRQVFHRDTPGIPGGYEQSGTGFATAMASGDVNSDGFDDLVIGAPGAGDTAQGAGAFHILYGSANGLTISNNQLLGQSFSGQADKTGDRFGAALAVGDVNGDRVADVIVGAPGRNNSAGQVYVYQGRRGQPLSGAASRILTQDNLLSGSGEAGDQFGATIDAKDINNDGFADVVIGAAGEDNNAGTVHIVFGSSAGVTSNVRTLQQGFSGIAGTRESSDRFGTGIAIGNFNGSGTAEIGISAPGESFANVSGAGMVNIVPV